MVTATGERAFGRLSQMLEGEGVTWIRLTKDADLVRRTYFLEPTPESETRVPLTSGYADAARPFDTIAVSSQDLASSARAAARLQATDSVLSVPGHRGRVGRVRIHPVEGRVPEAGPGREGRATGA